jgi:Down syndrome cell adhesion protein 1
MQFHTYKHAAFLLVATQQYKTGSGEEYVILGNDALLKCNIPSFVADFVSVHSWEDSEASIYHLSSSGSVASTFLS